VAWQFWPKSSGNSQRDVSNPKSAPNLAPRPSNFIQRGEVLHYIAGHKMDAWSEPGKPVVPAGPDSPVAAWQDLSLNGGEGTLVIWDKEKTSCPTYVIGNPGGLKAGTGMLHFDPGSALRHLMERSDARRSAYPFGDPVRSRGVTVMMIVRPQIRDKEVRCIRLRNQDGTAWLDVRAYPSNEWKLTIKAGPTMKDAKITGSSVTQFNLVGATWNLNSATAVMSVRGEDGAMQRTETEVPKEPHGVLNELRISDYSSSPAKPVPATDRFLGDIVEIVVWPYAMEWEERSGQEWRLMQFYFKHPGQRY
jgi:hypothetical protein